MATKNYIKVYEDNTQEATKYEPVYGLGNTRSEAGYNPDVYVNGVWYNSTNGTELVTNGTFDTDTSGWTATGNATLSVETGMLKVSSTTNGDGAYTDITTIIGKEYNISGIADNQGTGTCRINISFDSGTTWIMIGELTVSQFSYNIIAQSTAMRLFLQSSSSTLSKYDNISVFETEIEPDTAYTQGLTYLPYEVTVANGQVVDVDSKLFPTLVEDYVKANKVEANNLFGQGQTWQDVTASRADGVTYTNTTGKPIFISVWSNDNIGNLDIVVDGIIIERSSDIIGGNNSSVQAIVPNNSTYVINATDPTDIDTWTELR